MRDIARQILITAAVSLLCGFALTAAADAETLPLRFIDVLGRVTDRQGDGVEGVRVALDGAAEVAAITDASGGYSLTVPMSAVGDPARKSVTARIHAHRAGWAFALRNGQGALEIELRMQKGAEPPRCRVRSNALHSVDAIAAALRRGDRNAVIVNADFVGSEGGARANRVSLRSEAITVVGAPNEPDLVAKGAPLQAIDSPVPDPPALSVIPPAPGSVSTPDAAAQRPAPEPIVRPRSRPRSVTIGTDSAGAGRPVRGTRESPSSRPRIRRIESQDASRAAPPDTVVTGIVRLPGPGVTQTDASLIRRVEAGPGNAAIPAGRNRDDVLAGAGDCGCRIRGTVEIHPDHLLTRRLDLIVTLREAPGVRDTIQLFMGSPRPFELPAVRCGTWHIEVDAVARRDFSIVSADGRGPIDCREGGLHQLRVVLTPR